MRKLTPKEAASLCVILGTLAGGCAHAASQCRVDPELNGCNILKTVTITGCSGCSSISDSLIPVTLYTIGLTIAPGTTSIMASVDAELATEQRKHTNCVTALLLKDQQNPSTSPAPTNVASEGSVVRDANPIDLTNPTTSSGTDFAIEHGAIGQDYNVPSGYSPLAVFPNMGTGMSAAVALFQTPTIQAFTVLQAYVYLIDSSVPTATGISASDFAFYAVTGLNPVTTRVSSLTSAQLDDAVGSMSSASEGYHPASCYQ